MSEIKRNLITATPSVIGVGVYLTHVGWEGTRVTTGLGSVNTLGGQYYPPELMGRVQGLINSGAYFEPIAQAAFNLATIPVETLGAFIQSFPAIPTS